MVWGDRSPAIPVSSPPPRALLAAGPPQGHPRPRTAGRVRPCSPGDRGVSLHHAGAGSPPWDRGHRVGITGIRERGRLSLAHCFGGRCCGSAVCTRITKYWCSPPEAELLWLHGVPRPHRDAPGGSCPGRAGHRRRPPPAPAGRALTSLRSRPYLHETSATYRELTPRLEAWREKYLAVQ